MALSLSCEFFWVNWFYILLDLLLGLNLVHPLHPHWNTDLHAASQHERAVKKESPVIVCWSDFFLTCLPLTQSVSHSKLTHLALITLGQFRPDLGQHTHTLAP